SRCASSRPSTRSQRAATALSPATSSTPRYGEARCPTAIAPSTSSCARYDASSRRSRRAGPTSTRTSGSATASRPSARSGSARSAAAVPGRVVDALVEHRQRGHRGVAEVVDEEQVLDAVKQREVVVGVDVVLGPGLYEARYQQQTHAAAAPGGRGTAIGHRSGGGAGRRGGAGRVGGPARRRGQVGVLRRVAAGASVGVRSALRCLVEGDGDHPAVLV